VRLYLVRHAEAAPGTPDELRRLTTAGREQAQALGQRLTDEGVRPDAVLSSPLLRARETAEAIARPAGLTAVTDERLAPGATADDVRAVVEGRGELVVVVGHQPDCGRIAAELGDGTEPKLRPGAMVALEL
jgi:phosphohistidine phosphatase SixA